MAALPERTATTVNAIYGAYVANAWSGQAWRISMSDMGQECDRRIWLKLRWAHEPEAFDGQKLRLFKSDHEAEARLIADLRAAGINVVDRDPATRKQFEVLLAGGHLRGKVNGVATGFPEAPVVEHVLECKSMSDKNFKALLKDGIAVAKADHFATLQLYMHGLGKTRAAYLVVNKNDDALRMERVKYDPVAAMRYVARAESIVTADAPPRRLHSDPEARGAWQCRSCPALAVCHQGAWAPRNCRTCLHATALLDGRGAWHCARHDRELSIEDQRSGCHRHLYIPGLVAGEVVDSSEAEEWVEYAMADGSRLRDAAEPTPEPPPAPTPEETRAAIAEAVEGDEVVF